MHTATKILVTAFLFVHLGAYVIRISPLGIAAELATFEIAGHRSNVYELARSWQAFTVTGVSGELFAPLPSTSNVYVGAVVELDGGEKTEFRFPLPRDASGFLDEKRFEIFHKLGMSLVREENEGYHADFCRYVARRVAAEGRQPVRVRLLAYYSEIPLHNRPEIRLATEPVRFDYTRLLRDEAAYKEKTLLDYEVLPEDLA